MGQDGIGVLRTKNDEVNDAGIKTIAHDLVFRIRTADKDFTTFYSVHEPRGIKSGNIRTVTCIEDHDRASFRTQLPFLI